jgi:hypothetical protein
MSTGWVAYEIEGVAESDEEMEANARLMESAPDLRQASQELYDRLQEYLDVSDDQLIEQGHEGLVEAMDAMEAAWHKADDTEGEDYHEQTS